MDIFLTQCPLSLYLFLQRLLVFEEYTLYFSRGHSLVFLLHRLLFPLSFQFKLLLPLNLVQNTLDHMTTDC